MKKDKRAYLAIHGHFYQPPRENPWLETIEVQDSANPFHDWNLRVCNECYTPNSVSKIVTQENKIMDIVNNYSYLSFNFGPTLLSWMELHVPYTYERIIKADVISAAKNNGHGNAIAQVYNHIIMPLANKNDKYTQIIWGIKDFQYRFGRKPEGMWLAETACDDATLEALVDCGIKFTILSPFQAKSIRKLNSKENMQDVSWGNIDPARAYRYFIKSDKTKYIDLFFYDGSISKSVAFDELLKDGNKFIARLKDGISSSRDYNQLVNIATDGESYGHHTKFGDMALAYVLKVRAEDEGFEITNYANYLEQEGVEYEVDIKDVSSWSCAHGVGRWCDDCGCSTGGGYGWNQKWRKPLREALDYVRDELIKIFEEKASLYFKNVWEARNNYISVILDRGKTSIADFMAKNQKYQLERHDIVNALKLMEMQRQALLMYTSCGWFFSEISGIETTQIMKYAARAMQIAKSFSDKDIESGFLEILSRARSNISSYGTGKDVYEKFVKPSIVSIKQIAALWAISSLSTNYKDDTCIYCYNIKRHFYKHVSKGSTSFSIGRIEIESKITLEKSDFFFASLQFPEGDFHCAIKKYDENENISDLSKKLIDIYLKNPTTEIIRALDNIFGSEYYTLKDIIIEDRSKILLSSLKDKLDNFSNYYRDVYNEGKSYIQQLISLGINVPVEYKLAAQYTLSHDFNKLYEGVENITDEVIFQKAQDINEEALAFKIEIDKSSAGKLFSEQIQTTIYNFVKNFEIHRLNKILKIFEIAGKLDIKIDIAEAQNMYFNKIYAQFSQLLDTVAISNNNIEEVREFLFSILVLGEYLNINTDFYKSSILKLTSGKIQITN
ncbi:MAG: DUF3536 domain-containing protein [Candidatus Gastranaerophilales bacterium]|nr:DUF3536 domain-containing protein [Candidatus Gastranaerophilales bacterium]